MKVIRTIRTFALSGAICLIFASSAVAGPIEPIERPQLAECPSSTRVEVTPLRQRGDRYWNLVCEYRTTLVDNGNGETVCREEQEDCYEVERRYAGCFAYQTKIMMADGSERQISRIQPGDYVLNPKTGKGVQVERVVAGPEENPLTEITVAGTLLRVTGDHPMAILAGNSSGIAPASLSNRESTATVSVIRRADSLTTTDKLLFSDGSYRQIEAIGTASTSGEFVVNLELAAEQEAASSHLLISTGGIVTGDLSVQQTLSSTK